MSFADRWRRLSSDVNDRWSIGGSDEELRLTYEEGTQSNRRDIYEFVSVHRLSVVTGHVQQ
jgi:hypothetical protein